MFFFNFDLALALSQKALTWSWPKDLARAQPIRHSVCIFPPTAKFGQDIRPFSAGLNCTRDFIRLIYY